jgi:2-haloalkanoic acid dehalogenase type II
MPLTDYRLVSFACFGTLIDRDTGVAAALRPLLARRAHAPPRAQLLAAFDRHEADVLESQPGGTYAEVLAEAHRRLARAWHVDCVEQDHTLFGRSIADWPAYADAAGSLQYLQRYLRLAVISNADRETLRAVGRRLDVSFDVVCSAQDAGRFKPDRRLFELMLGRGARIGAAPDTSLHVAAGVAHDLVPAAAAGLACAWIDRGDLPGSAPGAGPVGPPPAGVDYVFRSLAQLVRTHQEHLRS